MSTSFRTGRNYRPERSAADAPDARRRHFDRRMNSTVVRVFQGDFYVTVNSTEVLTTILGSCIAVCVRDPVVCCGGMNHFLLPAALTPDQEVPPLAMRYGSFSIERLINDILSEGGRRERLEAKVFGGANVMHGTSNIGWRNADFVETYLKNEDIKIAARNLRGIWPRQVRYYPTTGKAQMRALKVALPEIFKQEEDLRYRPLVEEEKGDVEFFD